MDIQPTNQTMSDDQELAKVLAGMTTDTPTSTPSLEDVTPTTAPVQDAPVSSNQPKQEVTPAAAVNQELPTPPEPSTTKPSAPSSSNSELDTIKQQALGELRPLVDKLDVSADEKFSTYLLLLRSTDDKELIAPAHEAAKAIEDESARAQALLDIIKEIDFLSNQK